MTLEEKAVDIDKSLWAKYKGTASSNPEPYQALLWLETDIPEIVLSSPKQPSLKELCEEIAGMNGGKTVLKELHLNGTDEEIAQSKIAQVIEIRSNWPKALRNRSIKNIASTLGYGLNVPADLRALALIHKSKKYQKKIENFLDDINFHSESGEFSKGDYSKYLDTDKKKPITPNVFYTGGGIWISAAYVDDTHYYTTDNDWMEDALCLYDHSKEDQDEEFPCQEVVKTIAREDFSDEEEKIYTILHDALETQKF